MREFNTMGLCNPEMNYMVDITDRLAKIKTLIDGKKYFCINRARQYGKTTTLARLEVYLQGVYEVVSLDFQKIGSASFETEEGFVKAFSS